MVYVSKIRVPNTFCLYCTLYLAVTLVRIAFHTQTNYTLHLLLNNAAGTFIRFCFALGVGPLPRDRPCKCATDCKVWRSAETENYRSITTTIERVKASAVRSTRRFAICSTEILRADGFQGISNRPLPQTDRSLLAGNSDGAGDASQAQGDGRQFQWLFR